MQWRCFSFPLELRRTEEFNLLGTSVATEVFAPAKTATRKQEHPAECICLQTEIDTAGKKPRTNLGNKPEFLVPGITEHSKVTEAKADLN